MVRLVAVIGGEAANFAAYAYAPAILVTPLGALSIIFRFGHSASIIRAVPSASNTVVILFNGYVNAVQC